VNKIILAVILAGLSVLLNCCDPDSTEGHIKVIVLDNFDPDFTNPPFDDRVNILDYQGSLISQLTFPGFNIAGVLGGHREICTSKDGNYYAMGQYITNPGLSKYDMSGNLIQTIFGSTGWSLENNPNDGSVWVGTNQDLRHYSRTGVLMDTFTANLSISAVKLVALAVQ
jgi:hypothetical protein